MRTVDDHSADTYQQARADLERQLTARQDQVGGHLELAQAAERLGASTLATRAWQLVVRDDPTCQRAWRALATLYRERGDELRAQACAARLHDLAGAPAATTLPDALLVRLCDRFQGREGVYARMWHDPRRGSGYSPVHRPLTPEVLEAHIAGRITVGAYLMDTRDHVGQVVLDLDIPRPLLERALGDRHLLAALREEVAAEGFRLRDALRDAGLDPVLVDSGFKGRHLWCFLPERIPAREARRALSALLRAIGRPSGNLTLELFPKQDRVSKDGLGNLVKLPLGVHLRTRRRAAVLDETGVPDPAGAERLLAARTVALDQLTPPTATPPSTAAPLPDGPLVLADVDRDWTEADFDVSRQVGPVLRGCAVLRTLVADVLTRRTLSHGAMVALQHTLGHTADGVRAVNYLADRVPDFPSDQRMGAPLRGNPASCARIRRRVPDIAGQVPCDCRFPEEPGRYPNPLRHLDHAEPEPDPEPTLDDDLEAFARQLDRVRQAKAELARLEERVVAGLRRVPGQRWAATDGEWSLQDQDGVTRPVFQRGGA